MQPIQYARYRTFCGTDTKKEYEGCRCSSGISSISQKYYSILDILDKFISAENSIWGSSYKTVPVR